ncbi:MAPEG family protein [Alcanivorax quisquiliarum]|uniref:MAPEG family protein n=1 Tax=Alcanivorax quisquiliarum TaxID=2933565 RepID=A0ABT0E972_9GAMM|nr:MAPEG family protein [Alcanivorax quisquiliarum]MCK0538387.1 MAPEG family protein [Alcanivorax quisquiliarum]
MILTVTALYTGLFLILLLALAASVVRRRLRGQVSLGDGGDAALRQAIRAHGNAAEYVPIVLISLSVLENMGTSAVLLHLYGGVFFLGRLLHAWGLAQPQGVSNARKGGILLTWLVMLAMAVQLIWKALLHMLY